MGYATYIAVRSERPVSELVAAASTEFGRAREVEDLDGMSYRGWSFGRTSEPPSEVWYRGGADIDPLASISTRLEDVAGDLAIVGWSEDNDALYACLSNGSDAGSQALAFGVELTEGSDYRSLRVFLPLLRARWGDPWDVHASSALAERLRRRRPDVTDRMVLGVLRRHYLFASDGMFELVNITTRRRHPATRKR